MTLEQALQTYIDESRGLLADMEAALLQFEHAPNDAELINELFRAAHTIKGSAGLFGLDDIVSFTHVVEHILDRLREGHITATSDLIGTLLSCCDYIGYLIDVTAGTAPDTLVKTGNEPARRSALLAALEPYADHAPASKQAAGSVVEAAHVQPAASDERSTEDRWEVNVRFGADVLRNGMDPASIIRYLGRVAEIEDVAVDMTAIPDLPEMDPETSYLGFTLTLKQVSDPSQIEEAFEFVRDDCSLNVRQLAGDDSAPVDAASDGSTGFSTVNCVDQGSDSQGFGAGSTGGDLPIQTRQPAGRDTLNQSARFIRVNAERLDELINLIGELVIAGASAEIIAQRLGDAPMQEAMVSVRRFVEEIRESALRLRMVQIGETFNRFHRVVRDVSRELGKDIRLVIQGADTELDKTVIEKIGDPLTHLVRNAMDHGIESAQKRIAAGKPAQGTVKLNAFHDSGSIVIEVIDDGGGLDAARLYAKAVEKGVVAAGTTLSPQEVLNLVFAPGLSTSGSVTNLSGRGVGMDVVKRNIEALRGSVEIESTLGQGTTVRIRLPLTLAIIDGFLVGVGNAAYVIPLDMVIECIELSPEDRHASEHRDYINLRGEVLPYLRLSEQFGVTPQAGRRENIVIVRYGEQKAGLVVDSLMGEFQTVIKPLGKVFQRVQGISGSTILGNGDVALILDVPSLLRLVARQDHAHNQRSTHQTAIS